MDKRFFKYMRTSFLIGILITLVNTVGYSIDYYVSPKGSDKNPGTIHKPFKTLKQARDAVRIYKKGNNKPENITVWLRGGVYVFDETFLLQQEDSGTEGFPVVYEAFPDEEVRCIGGKYLPASAIQPVTDENTLNQLIDPSAKSKIRMVNLRALCITDYGQQKQFGFGLPVVNSSMELFINDEKMQLARYPNTEYMKIGKLIDSGSVPRQNDYENERGGTFEYTDKRHEKWAGLKNVWLKGTFNRGYADDRILVKEINTDKKQVVLASPHMYGIGSGEKFQQYFAENIFAEIDMPGEYFIDEANSILYFWPPREIAASSMVVSTLEKPMVSLLNASYIEFKGIIFEVSRGMGFYIEQGGHNRVAGCVLRNLGTVAVMMGQGAQQTFPHLTHDQYEGVPVSEEVGSLSMQLYNHTGWDRKAGSYHGIQSCEIYNTGTGAIVLSGGNKKQLIPGYCYVDNCRIHDFQTRIATQGTAISVDGCGNRVSHNEIYNSEQQAILVRGNNHVFEFNEIHHIALNTNDASAWYMGRDPSDQGHIIRNNFFHHVGRPDRELTMGIYFDDSACGTLVEGNVFFKVASYGTIYSNAGSDLVVRNNIFIEGYGPALHLKSRWWDGRLIDQSEAYYGTNGLFRKRLTNEVDIKSPPYSTSYPNLVDYLDKTSDGFTYKGMFPQRNVMENNVIVKYKESCRLVGINANVAFSNNVAFKDDPGFVDAANMNFELKRGSVVFERIPDFKEIPFNKIGLVEDQFRVKIDHLKNNQK